MSTIKIILKIIKLSVKTVLVIMGILPFSRCSSGYKNENGKVTFNGREITDKNFIVLSDEFAKDATNAYYKSRCFSYADVASFQAVDEHYAKDKDRVYYCDEYREGQNYYLTKKTNYTYDKNAHPASFQSLGSGYAKDSTHGYFVGTAFKVKDVKTLKAIDVNFAKDDMQAYINRLPISGSDGKTFELIDPYYAKDTNHIYFYNAAFEEGDSSIITVPCHRASFDTLKYPYSKDNASIFYQGKKINGIDVSTFAILQHGYSKDKDAVYFGAKKIPGANAATFELYPENESSLESPNYAKDKSTVFADDRIVVGADVSTFKVLALGYGSDDKHVFFKTNLVKEANSLSFKTYDHGFGETDSEDAKNKYLAGKKVLPE